MYLPAVFEERDPTVLRALMREHPLAAIVMNAADGFEANHVPLLVIEGETLRLCGHVARGNPLARATGPALAIFQGAQGYVSPSWYPSKALNGESVPTWNYAVVHAHGTLRTIDDATWLRSHLAQLTERHEETRTEPWRMDDAPAAYLERMMRGVVGIEIAVDRLEGKWKVSQNRGEADRAGVVAGLEGDGGTALANLMRSRGGK